MVGQQERWRRVACSTASFSSYRSRNLRSFVSTSSSTGSSNNNPSATPGGWDPAISAYLSQHLKATQLLAETTEEQRNDLYAKMIHSLEAVYGKNKVKVSHLHSFGAAGLQALAASILNEEEEQRNSSLASDAFVTVRFTVPHHRTQFDLKWHYASELTLLDVAESPQGAELLSEYIEASCGGHASCCTCHVYIDTNNNNHNHNDSSSRLEKNSGGSTAAATAAIKLSEATEAELDMLDLAYQPTDQSRLACQVRLLHAPSREQQQNSDEPLLTVTIPSGVNNVWN